MDKVQKPSVNECCTPSSEPYRVYEYTTVSRHYNGLLGGGGGCIYVITDVRYKRVKGIDGSTPSDTTYRAYLTNLVTLDY
jgi:hypothetical protein